MAESGRELREESPDRDFGGYILHYAAAQKEDVVKSIFFGLQGGSIEIFPHPAYIGFSRAGGGTYAIFSAELRSFGV
jgi:hypothetical protein